MCSVCEHLDRCVKDYGFAVQLRQRDLERVTRVFDDAEAALVAHRVSAHGRRA